VVSSVIHHADRKRLRTHDEAPTRSTLRWMLQREGVRYVPDRVPDRALRRLRESLRARAGDARFWTETARLAASEVSALVDGGALDRDLLRGRVLGGVLIDLRGSVASDAPVAAWLASLPDAARLAFFIVALAAGPVDETAGRRIAPWARGLFRVACAAGAEYESAGLLALLSLRTAADFRAALDTRAPWSLPDLASAVAWLDRTRAGSA
jgi:hypothetical protein